MGQRLHPVALAKHGYEKARRIGMLAMVGGKNKTAIRNGTPPPFRDVLLDLARRTRIPEGLASQHVLKAEAARPDATDREFPANASPGGGSMGAVQPAAAGHVEGVAA